MKKTVLLGLAFMLALPATLPAAEAQDVWASVLFPGLGQIRSSRYGRGSLFISAELVSLAALFIADIQYDRAAEQYNEAKLNYLNASYIVDAEGYYDTMIEKWDQAEDLDTYRKVFAGAAVGVWVVSIADMIWGGDADRPELSLEVDRDRFLVTKTVSF